MSGEDIEVRGMGSENGCDSAEHGGGRWRS